LLIFSSSTISAEKLHEIVSDELFQQLNGEGCKYMPCCYKREPNKWWRRFILGEEKYPMSHIRNPEYNCRMAAACCIATIGAKSKKALESVKKDMPASFDTGDGVLNYLDCINAAIKSVEENDSIWLARSSEC